MTMASSAATGGRYDSHDEPPPAAISFVTFPWAISESALSEPTMVATNLLFTVSISCY